MNKADNYLIARCITNILQTKYPKSDVSKNNCQKFWKTYDVENVKGGCTWVATINEERVQVKYSFVELLYLIFLAYSNAENFEILQALNVNDFYIKPHSEILVKALQRQQNFLFVVDCLFHKKSI
jgi:hypothetical protein